MDPRETQKPQPRPGTRHGDALRAALRRLPAYVYLDDVFRGRHILEVGCGDGLGAYHLARSGAASVIGLERGAAAVDAARARWRQSNLTFAAADFSAIDLADGAVDVVCVPNGEELARWPAFLSEARRVLARDGVLIVTAPSGDRGGNRGVPFHDLIGRLEPLFPPVRMIGITPFVGFALVEYADSSEVLDVELDTTLCDGGGGRDPVTDYVAFAGAGAAEGAPRGYMVVEVPPIEGLPAVAQAREARDNDITLAETRERPVAAAAASASASTSPAPKEDPDIRRRLARAVEERTGAEVEVQALRARLGLAEEEIGRVAAQAARELGEARRALHVSNARIEALEAQLVEARRGYESRTMDTGEQRRLEAEIAQRGEMIARLEDELAERDEELSNIRLEMAPLEVMVRAAEGHEAEMRHRNAALAERDAFVEELQQELDEVIAAQQSAVEAAREASLRSSELEVETRELRSRVSAAEGELLRHRSQPALAADPARVAELETQLAEKTVTVEKASARWREAEGKTDELWKKIGELQKEMGAAREQAVENARQQRQAAQIALTRAVDEASKKLVSAQDQTVRTERERQELEREATALRARVVDLEGEALGLRERLASLSGAREVTESRLSTLEDELRALEAGVRAEEERAGALAARLGAMAERMDVPPPPEEPPPPPPEEPPAPAEAE